MARGRFRLRPENTPALIVGLLLSLGLGLASVIVVMTWQEQLPDPLAVHFGFGGQADGYASATAHAWTSAAFVAGFGSFMVLTVTLADPMPRIMRRIVYGLSIGATVFVAVLMIAMVEAQRGLDEASAASFPASTAFGWPLILGIAAGVLAAPLIRR